MFRNLLGYLRYVLESLGIIRRSYEPVSIYSFSEGSFGYTAPMLPMGGHSNPFDDWPQIPYPCGNLDDQWKWMPMDFDPAHHIPDPFDEPVRPLQFPSILGRHEQPVWIDDEHGIGANDSWAIEAWMLKVTDGKVGFRELLEAGFDFGPEFQKMIWMPPENDDPFRKLMDKIADVPDTVSGVDEFIDSLFPPIV